MKKYYEKFKILMYPYKLAKKESIISFSAFWFNFFQSVYKVQILSFVIAAITSKNLNELYFWIIIFVILKLFTHLCLFIWDNYDVKLLYKTTYKLQSLYLKKFIELDNNKVESLGTWRANSIIIKWIDTWVDIYINQLAYLIFAIFAIFYSFWIIIFSVWIKYFILFFAIFLLMFSIIIYWNNISLKYRKLKKEVALEYDRNIIKIIMSKFEILQNNKFGTEDTKMQIWIEKMLKLWIIERYILSIWTTWVSFVNDFIKIVLFLWLWVWVITWKVELAHFVLIYWLVDIIETYSWDISREIKSIWTNIVDVDKLLETFDNIQEIKWINNQIPFIYSSWNIQINNLTYWYCEDNIFTNFSLDIKWQNKTALVWDSGSGKTTLMKLIAWYIHPKSWEIVVDNQNIQDINLISYYKNIWYLTQEPSVFDWTIMENLTYALDREPTTYELDNTIKSSKCEFIYELANWMETEIWERWVKLSGGQKQRLAIAKIMLKNPNIILLDEPTSALDSISEQVVSEAFHNLFVWRTVMVIAHRLQTVKESDDIIVLKKWQIIERWTHAELSKIIDWEYKKMLDLQTSF